MPPISAIADVLALWHLDGWLTPPLAAISFANDDSTTTVSGTACNVTIGYADTGPGLSSLNELLSTDLTGRVVVIGGAQSVGGAVWGEILTCAAMNMGAAAVLVDGAVRDRLEVADLGFPMYARNERVVGPAGRAHVLSMHTTVSIDSVELDDGDLVVADATGCVRVRAHLRDEVLQAAQQYAEGEEQVVQALRAGEPLTSAYRHKKAVVDQLRRQV